MAAHATAAEEAAVRSDAGHRRPILLVVDVRLMLPVGWASVYRDDGWKDTCFHYTECLSFESLFIGHRYNVVAIPFAMIHMSAFQGSRTSADMLQLFPLQLTLALSSEISICHLHVV